MHAVGARDEGDLKKDSKSLALLGVSLLSPCPPVTGLGVTRKRRNNATITQLEGDRPGGKSLPLLHVVRPLRTNSAGIDF